MYLLIFIDIKFYLKFLNVQKSVMQTDDYHQSLTDF